MAPLLVEDLDLFLADFAVPVTANGVSGSGILDQNSEIILGGEVAMIDYVLTVKTSEFGSLAYGDLITVDGDTYKVETQPLRIDDGRFCKVPLVLTVAVNYKLLLEDGYLLLLETADALLLD